MSKNFFLGLIGPCFCLLSVANAADYRATALALDPAVYLSLDETALGQMALNLANGASRAGASGNAVYDSSGPQLGVPPLVSPPVGTSIRFGENTLRNTSDITTAGATGYTIAFWLRSSANPGGPMNLVGDGDSPLGFYAMVYLLADGKVRAHAQVATDFVSVDTNVAVTDGNIHHVLARYSQPAQTASGLLDSYIDGALQASLITTRNTISDYRARLYVGQDLRETNSTDVTLDEVALWRRGLSDAEVRLVTGLVFSNGFE